MCPEPKFIDLCTGLAADAEFGDPTLLSNTTDV
jgi:hypothetical protein